MCIDDMTHGTSAAFLICETADSAVYEAIDGCTFDASCDGTLTMRDEFGSVVLVQRGDKRDALDACVAHSYRRVLGNVAAR